MSVQKEKCRWYDRDEMSTLRFSDEIAWDSTFLMDLLALEASKFMEVVADRDMWQLDLELLAPLLITRPKFY